MMYSEYIKKGGKGIIQLLKENQCLNYLPSEAITPMDTAFNFENGMKIFSLPVENLLKTSNDLTPIANMIKYRFASEWEQLFATLPSDQAPLYGTIRQTTGKTNTDTKNTVAGYDDSEMVNDTGSSQNVTNDVTEKTLDFTELTKLLGELKNNNYYDTIFSDIRNYIFNTVYGNERTE